MDINFRNVSAFSQATPEGLNSVTDGLTSSLDARGIIAIDNAIQSFGDAGAMPFEQTSAANVGGPGSLTGPAEYLSQFPNTSSNQALISNLQDPNFKINDSLSTVFNSLFKGEGGVSDLASQLGINANANNVANTGMTQPVPLQAGENPLASSFPYRMPEETPLESSPLNSAIQLSDLTSQNPLESSVPYRMPEETPLELSRPTVRDHRTQASLDLTSQNPLESSIPVSSGLPNANPLNNAIQGNSPQSEIPAVQQFGDPSAEGSDDPGSPPITITPESTGGTSEASQFQMNLLQNNFPKLQNLGTTLNQMISLQQDLTERRGS